MLIGWKSSEAVSKNLQDVFNIINERTRQPAFNPVETVLRTGTVVGLANHTVLVTRDRSEIPIDDSAAPISDGSGNVTGAILVFRDITEQKQAQKAQNQLAAIIKGSEDAIISKNLDGIITSWNRGAEQMYGFSAEEVIGKHISILIPPDYPNDVSYILEHIRRGESLLHYETKRCCKNGTVLDVSLTISPIFDDEGKVIGASKIARDITEQKRLQTLREQLAAIVEGSDDAIISKDLNGIITSWNKGAQHMYGYTADEVVGKHISMLIPPGYPNDVPNILARIQQGEQVVHYETKRRAKDGRVLDVSLTVSPIHDLKGNVICASKIARDIT
jgi:PAS domain S-box-containing protein